MFVADDGDEHVDDEHDGRPIQKSISNTFLLDGWIERLGDGWYIHESTIMYIMSTPNIFHDDQKFKVKNFEDFLTSITYNI